MSLLEEVKIRLRIKSSAFDGAEVQPLIDACKKDMARVGVSGDDSDPLVRQAVVLYCKANFGFSGDSDRYQRAYEALRDSIALSGEYGGGGGAVP